jgi:hypothetical protein
VAVVDDDCHRALHGFTSFSTLGRVAKFGRDPCGRNQDREGLAMLLRVMRPLTLFLELRG